MVERINRFVEYCPLLAAWCFIPAFLNVVYQNLFWLLGIQSMMTGGVLAIITSVVVLFITTSGNFSRKEFVLIALAFFLFAIIAAVAATYFYDGTRDGTSYHQEAVIQMKEGWNPIRE